MLVAPPGNCMHPPADVPVFIRSVRLQVLEGVCQSFILGAVAATGECADKNAFFTVKSARMCWLQGLTTCCHDAGGLAWAARTMKLILKW